MLAEGPLLADGGMGTSLIERGAPADTCLEELNHRDPELITAIHRAFLGAGARLVLTNTFGANRYRLERHGSSSRVTDLCAEAVHLAHESGAQLVGGSVGPLGVRLSPYGRVRPDEAFAAYLEQIAALAEAGVDLVVIETQTDLAELEQAVLAAREAAPELGLIASATLKSRSNSS